MYLGFSLSYGADHLQDWGKWLWKDSPASCGEDGWGACHPHSIIALWHCGHEVGLHQGLPALSVGMCLGFQEDSDGAGGGISSLGPCFIPLGIPIHLCLYPPQPLPAGDTISRHVPFCSQF